MESQREHILKNMEKTLSEESIKYKNGNIIIYKNKVENETVSYNSFIEEPKKYLNDVGLNINLFLLLIEFIENNQIDNLQKIINTDILTSEFYDASIDIILNKKIDSIEKYAFDIIKILYEKITLQMREYLLANCITYSQDKNLDDWILETLENEPYLEISKILQSVLNMNESFFNRIIEIYPFDSIKNELFIIMFQNIKNANLFINVYKEKTKKENLLDINPQKVIPIIISKLLTEENKEIGSLIFNNLELDPNENFIWFIYGLIKSKFEILNYIFENSNIKTIDKEVVYNCLVICQDINLNMLGYLKNNINIFGNLDFTCKNHHIIRNAIMNDKVDIIKFLLENNVYPKYSDLMNDELLNNTISFFASDEVNDVINNFYPEIKYNNEK